MCILFFCEINQCLFLLFINFKLIYCYMKTCEPIISTDVTPTVKIPDLGTFIGSATVSLKKKRTIYQYLGIPYAMPPVGSLRFKAPVPLTQLNYSHTYNAKYFKRKCPQIFTEEDYDELSSQRTHEIVEDCLYLNVFTVTNEGAKYKSLLPVMIYIHGGAYFRGSAMDHCPNYFLDHDIILVTLQYRLGALGFLNLETDEVSGNMGLLDTIEALKWVSRNIKYFGGDNKRITVSGQSSGATSVSLMLVSPLVIPGLFQQVIIQSGNFLVDWSSALNTKKCALEFAKKLNCSQTNMTELVQCLSYVSAFKLTEENSPNYMIEKIRTSKNIIKEIGIAHAVVQKRGQKKFLIENPEKSLKNGRFVKVPILTGVMNGGGSLNLELLVYYILKPAYEKVSITDRKQFAHLKNEFYRNFLKFNDITENVNQLEFQRNYYLPDTMCDNFNHTAPALVNLDGAAFVKTKVFEFARYTWQHVPTYLYTFNYKGKKLKLGYKRPVKYLQFDVVAHSNELRYLFPDSTDPTLDEEEVKLVENMVSLWCSFIINGGKNISSMDVPQWFPMNSTVGPYLQIDQDLRITENFLDENSNYASKINFYNSIIKIMPNYTLQITFLVLILMF